MIKKIEKQRCYLYVLNTLSDWEVGFITAELKSKRYISKDMDFELIILGNTLEAISTMGGALIKVERTVENVVFKEGDILILPGANTWLEDENKKILDLLPDLLKKKVIVAAICGATIALAQKGLLDNKKHTSNDKEFLTIFCPMYKGTSLYRDSPVVVDENLITATGLAPLDFSYEIFKKIDAMKADTLEAWYQLYKTKEAKYFYSLMESIK